jgi:large subunit ribosomal protein L22
MAEPAAAPKAPEVAPAAPKARFTARLRYARISARKMRYVVDLIRGKDYNSAISILRVCPKRGAMFCKKLLESAFGNATEIAQSRNMDLDGNKLHVVEARVDPGPIIKRWRPSSVRRPNQIKKRMCHVTVALEERELKESRRDRAKRQRQDRQKKPAAPKPAAAPEAQAPAAPAEKPPAAHDPKKTGRKKAGGEEGGKKEEKA